MIDARQIRQMVDAEVSTRGRVGHIALLLCAATMTIGLGTLWATEPELPLRTHVAFASMVAIGCAWTIYAAWVLTTRSVMLARHRIIAAWMGILFSTAFTVLFAAVGYSGQLGNTPFVAAAVESVLIGVAVVMLIRARRRFADLVVLRNSLEHQVRARQ